MRKEGGCECRARLVSARGASLPLGTACTPHKTLQTAGCSEVQDRRCGSMVGKRGESGGGREVLEAHRQGLGLGEEEGEELIINRCELISSALRRRLHDLPGLGRAPLLKLDATLALDAVEGEHVPLVAHDERCARATCPARAPLKQQDTQANHSVSKRTIAVMLPEMQTFDGRLASPDQVKMCRRGRREEGAGGKKEGKQGL